MGFQIHALPKDIVAGLSEMSDAALAARNIKRQTALVSPGYPCRISLEDAQVGETVYLMNYTHIPQATPYQASHAIFVREKARQANPEPNEIPASLALRVLSLRAFDQDHQMVAAELAQGEEIAPKLQQLFAKPQTDYIHLHYAKPGCFAARAVRLD
jgi:Protein of unknown function (DUF1203)